VTPEFDNRLREIAAATGKMLTEILEEALRAYERENTTVR
jgi:predicted transcriptional regulator